MRYWDYKALVFYYSVTDQKAAPIRSYMHLDFKNRLLNAFMLVFDYPHSKNLLLHLV